MSIVSIIRSGFGSFNYVLPGWQDTFSTLITNSVCIGTEIQGGSTGARITSIGIEPAHQIGAGSNQPIPMRCIVTRGRVSNLNPFITALRGWPDGSAEQLADLQWSKMICIANTDDNYIKQGRTHFPFPRGGPFCNPGDVLGVYFLILIDKVGSPGYGLGNVESMSLSVLGKYSLGRVVSGSEKGRSIPQGVLG